MAVRIPCSEHATKKTEEGRRAERDATRQTGGAKPMIFAPNKEKAEKSSSAERLPCL
jgi:hypothetical protein